MGEHGMAELRAALGAEPPAALAAVDDEHLSMLAAVVHEAHDRQARQLREAADVTLRHVPSLLRRPVRKALFG